MRQQPGRRTLHLDWLCATIALAALVLTASGCSVSGKASAAPTAITSAHVLRTSAFPANHIPPFERTVTAAAQAQALYTALLALPPFPKEVFSCPIDVGEAYQLTFYKGQTHVFSAIVQPDGCEAVNLANGDVRWAVNQGHFWATFAAALSVSQATLFQGPQPSGPSAPQPAPNQRLGG